MNITKQDVQQAGIHIMENNTKLKRINESITISIPKEFVLQQRVKSKMSLSAGDVIQETLAIVNGYETLNGWINNCKATITSDVTSQYYRYHIPVGASTTISVS